MPARSRRVPMRRSHALALSAFALLVLAASAVMLARSALSRPFCVGGVRLVSQLTGAGSPSETAERWNVHGADLGFPVEHHGDVYLVFGDTWGAGGVEADDWRSNTMGRIEPDPVHGIRLTDMVEDEPGNAAELLGSKKLPGDEYTKLPSSGVTVDERIYLHFMSVRDWETHPTEYKHPIVNHGGLAVSMDHGETWEDVPDVWWQGDGNFAQATMVPFEGYVYLVGTPGGRLGPARLGRVTAEGIEDPAAYEYWTGDGWVPDPEAATDIVPAPVGELSVRWSEYHGRWLMTYLNEDTHRIVLRAAEELTGPWSAEHPITNAGEFRYLYAPYLLPMSDGPELLFTMSRFDPYNVFVLSTTLSEREGGGVLPIPCNTAAPGS